MFESTETAQTYYFIFRVLYKLLFVKAKYTRVNYTKF